MRLVVQRRLRNAVPNTMLFNNGNHLAHYHRFLFLGDCRLHNGHAMIGQARQCLRNHPMRTIHRFELDVSLHAPFVVGQRWPLQPELVV